MSSPRECLRCRGPMEAGFVMDRANHGYPTTQEWVEGAPIKSFWRGLDTRNRDVLPVRTYRCERCGMLEAYAGPGG